MASDGDNGQAREPLARGVAAGFALVASREGPIDPEAIVGFGTLLRSDDRFEQVDRRRAEHALRGTCQGLLSDAVRARALARGALEALRGDAAGVRLAVAAAEHAALLVGADGRALDEVRAALGVASTAPSHPPTAGA